MTPSPSARRGRRPTFGGIAVSVSGAVLFIYFVQRAGVGEIVDGIQRLGWAFLIVVALGGVRHFVRAAAWRQCMEPSDRLGFWKVFQAVIAGDALGNLTPLSLIVSEPAKGMFLRDRAPLWRTLPALAVENLFYTLSAILVIAGGLVALFLVLQTPGQLWVATAALILSLVSLVTVAHGVIWHQVPVVSATLSWFHDRGIAAALAGRTAARVRSIEQHIYGLYPRDLARLFPVATLELSFHCLAILEIYLVLSLVSDLEPTILDAVIFESTNRLIAILFKFVPLRIGIDEAGTGMFADLLAFGTATGVTLAIVRKARMLVWIGLGIGALVRRGLSVGQVLDETQSNVAVVVMARSPSGSVSPKTRLAGQISTDEVRRRLYAAFLSDTITACRGIDGTTLRVACTPDGGTAGLRELGITDDELVTQRGADLGARERAVFDDLFEAGFGKVVVIGSDVPTLPTGYIRQAVALIDEGSAVLGPSEDGGYYLIGLAAPDSGCAVPDLFSNIRWSTPSALDDTLAAAVRVGVQVKLVPGWYDVDDGEGLSRLRHELDEPAGRRRAPETAQVSGELFPRSETGAV